MRVSERKQQGRRSGPQRTCFLPLQRIVSFRRRLVQASCVHLLALQEFPSKLLSCSCWLQSCKRTRRRRRRRRRWGASSIHGRRHKFEHTHITIRQSSLNPSSQLLRALIRYERRYSKARQGGCRATCSGAASAAAAAAEFSQTAEEQSYCALAVALEA